MANRGRNLMLLAVLCLGSVLGLPSCASPVALNSLLQAAPTGEVYTQLLDMSIQTPSCSVIGNTTGGTCILTVDTSNMTYSNDPKSWALSQPGDSVHFNINLANPQSLTFNIDVSTQVKHGRVNSPVSILVNDYILVSKYAYAEENFHPVAWKIPASLLKNGDNKVTFILDKKATNWYFIRSVTLSSFDEAQRIVAEGHDNETPGTLTTPLYVQFGLTNVVTGNDSTQKPNNEIWTRAYSRYPPFPNPDNPNEWLPNEDIVPGPTMVFQPNDILTVDFNNFLNEARSPWLKNYVNAIQSGNPDDIEEHVPHEINIPHNANNTNLHTHGLHVDPRRDNVTLQIIPQDHDLYNGYMPELLGDIPNALGTQIPGNQPGNGNWWTWRYQYKIPKDHLPGTHWYHAHKHGSTSTHVENGMAGSFVVQPFDKAATFSPGLWNDDPAETHDRVLVLQEIGNYGVQQGKGDGMTVPSGFSNQGSAETPDITINGIHKPTLQLVEDQIERWRFINAGANHRNASYIWLGKKESGADTWTAAVPEDGSVSENTPQMYLVALDGITLNKPVLITAKEPLLMSAGNRADVMVRIPAGTSTDSYAIFKNYPKTKSDDPTDTTLIQAPADLNVDAFDLKTNYLGNKLTWIPYKKGKIKTKSMVPLLYAKANGNAIDIDLRSPGKAEILNKVGWQPSTNDGGGLVDNQLLFYVNMVKGTPKNGSEFDPIPNDLSTIDLSPYSPTGSGKALYGENNDKKIVRGIIPGYASPIKDSQINMLPQPMNFDFAMAVFNYQPTDSANVVTTMKQFSLNGRQFELDDFVGNPAANDIIQKPIPGTVTFKNGERLGSYEYSGGSSNWTNQISGLDNKAYWTNPGYFVPVKYDSDTSAYTYDYDNPTGKPTLEIVTGLDQDSQPTNRKAQEWLLINNSSIFHPFHIHINPFFVTEIGQLNYDATNGWRIHYIEKDFQEDGSIANTKKSSGYMVNKTDESVVDYTVGNWWDVIMIPPKGYVKLKTWINVPWQNLESSKIEENTNNSGTWVFHCHILRHEDRGMMMIVKTKPDKKTN